MSRRTRRRKILEIPAYRVSVSRKFTSRAPGPDTVRRFKKFRRHMLRKQSHPSLVPQRRHEVSSPITNPPLYHQITTKTFQANNLQVEHHRRPGGTRVTATFSGQKLPVPASDSRRSAPVHLRHDAVRKSSSPRPNKSRPRVVPRHRNPTRRPGIFKASSRPHRR